MLIICIELDDAILSSYVERVEKVVYKIKSHSDYESLREMLYPELTEANRLIGNYRGRKDLPDKIVMTPREMHEVKIIYRFITILT